MAQRRAGVVGAASGAGAASASRAARIAAILVQGAAVALGAGCLDEASAVAPLLDDGAGPVALEAQGGALEEEGGVLVVEATDVAPDSLLECARCVPSNDTHLDPDMLADRWGQQGTVLHGIMDGQQCTAVEIPRAFRLDEVERADHTRLSEVRVDRNKLVSKTDGSVATWTGAYVNARLSCAGGAGTLPVRARIAEVQADAEDAGTMYYRVELVDPRTGLSFPACRDAFERHGGGWAIPFAGVWDASGEYHGDTDAFTFACVTSAVSKCSHEWGYHPWDRSSGKGPLRNQELHQACTRMARADYCGDGVSWTNDGTTVHLWDGAGTTDREDPPYPGFKFEAAWTTGGALCFDHPRISKRDPACAETLPACSSEQEAGGMITDIALMFNASVP